VLQARLRDDTLGRGSQGCIRELCTELVTTTAAGLLNDAHAVAQEGFQHTALPQSSRWRPRGVESPASVSAVP
jgi:hypothetical protein